MDKSIIKSKSVQISIISIAVNLALTIIKLLAGLFGHSQALIADSVHSASDVISTVIVIVSLVISARPADANHHYGHQKYESVATLILAIILGQVGVKIGYDAILNIYHGTYKDVAIPSILTVVAAALSIAVKEAMFHVTMSVAKKEKSNALKADAWHHRSDAISSIGSLVGVLFAIFGLPIMDSIASIIICALIIKTAIEILLDAIKGLTDNACDKKTETALRELVESTEGVLALDSLKTRVFGSGCYVDVEIQVDSQLTIADAHEIAEKVHDSIESNFSEVWHCMVHVNPKA